MGTVGDCFDNSVAEAFFSGLQRELLDRHRDDGRMLASLRASEGVIYGRFGFGVAGDANGVVVDAPRARPVQGRAPGSFRLLAAEEMRGLLPEIYEQLARVPAPAP